MSPSTGTILVGYDGSAAADSALQWAARTASLEGRKVRALMAVSDSSSSPASRGVDPAHEMRARVDAVLAAAGVSGAAEWHSGHVVPILLREAIGASMLVVGSQGHGWAAETVRGSVSQHLARHAPCPAGALIGTPAQPTCEVAWCDPTPTNSLVR